VRNDLCLSTIIAEFHKHSCLLWTSVIVLTNRNWYQTGVSKLHAGRRRI